MEKQKLKKNVEKYNKTTIKEQIAPRLLTKTGICAKIQLSILY